MAFLGTSKGGVKQTTALVYLIARETLIQEQIILDGLTDAVRRDGLGFILLPTSKKGDLLRVDFGSFFGGICFLSTLEFDVFEDILKFQPSFDQILVCLNSGIVLWDKDLELKYVSQNIKNLLGFGSDKVIDLGIKDFKAGTTAERTQRKFMTDHGPCYLALTFRKVVDKSDSVTGYMSICQDITDQELNSDLNIMRSKLQVLNLNQKQIKIIEMLTRGESNKGIAQAINLSEQGVKYHVGNLLERFGTRNRLELRSKIYEMLKQ